MATVASSNVSLGENLNYLSSLLAQNQTDERSQSEYILEVRKLKPGKEAEFNDLSQQRSQVQRQLDFGFPEASNPNSPEIAQIDRRINFLLEEPVVTERNVIGTEAEESVYGGSQIKVRLNSEGTKEYAKLTKEVAGTNLPIFFLVNGEVVSQPVVDASFSDTGITTEIFTLGLPNFSLAQAEEIAAEIERASPHGMTSEREIDERSQSKYILQVRKLKLGKEAEFDDLSQQRNQIEKRLYELYRLGKSKSNSPEIAQAKKELAQIDRRIISLLEEPVVTERNVIGAKVEESAYHEARMIARLDREGTKEYAELTKEVAGTDVPIFFLVNGKIAFQQAVDAVFSDTGIASGFIMFDLLIPSPAQAEEIAAEIMERAISYGTTQEPKIEQSIQTANRQYQQQQDQVTLAYYDIVINGDPTRADAYLAQAKIHYARKDFETAIPLYEEALALEPSYFMNNEDIMPSLVKSYLKTGDRQNALAIWERRTKIQPAYEPMAAFGQGLVLVLFGDLEQGIKKFDRAIELNNIEEQKYNSGSASTQSPVNFGVYWYRGLVHEHLNQTEEAISDFQKVKEIDLNFLLSNLEYYSKPQPVIRRAERTPQGGIRLIPLSQEDNELNQQLQEQQQEQYREQAKKTARVFYLKSLACQRLNDKECANKNRNVVRELLGFRGEEVAKFRTEDDTFSRLLNNSTQIIDRIARQQ